jgi:hypothetical protein
MKQMIAGIFLVVFCALPGRAQEPGRSQNIQVTTFTLKGGLDVPQEYLTALMGDIVGQLIKTGKFAQVLRDNDKPADADRPSIKLTGLVIGYEKGNRAVRYMVGFGAGRSRVKAHVKVENSTGSVLAEKDVSGTVWIGLFGGDSAGASEGLAKHVANLAQSAL